ncbi:MAG: cation transporter [Clostridia bacterium]|nr:cation transporter [Clostridia bacterium]
MIRLLAKLFIKSDLPADRQRGTYGALCGIVGIVLNVLLFAGKLFAGWLSRSIAVTADAFNNLSDAASSAVTLVGFKLAGKKPDAGHPYGHGRIEYVAGLAVSGVILLMAFELIRDSVTKIITPQQTEFSVVTAVILLVSIAVKCYMAFYNFRIGGRIQSAALRATAKDSLSDCVATLVVLVGMIVSHTTSLSIDGYCGVVVGLFIGWAGISAAKETLDPLLGQPPKREYVEKIEKTVLEFDPCIVGVHDLLVHDYGPGRQIISLHAEVPADGDILALHDMIDNLEKTLAAAFGCQATVHMDPVVINDPFVDTLKRQVTAVVHALDSSFTLHDFRVVVGPTHTNVIFDLVVPYEHPLSEKDIRALVAHRIHKEIGEDVFAVIQIDYQMVE